LVVMSPSVVCTTCGSMNSVTAETCEVCGAALGGAGGQTAEPISEYQSDPLRGRKPTMLMRVVAGFWFAVTGFVPALIYFLATSRSSRFPLESRVLFGFLIIPTASFALCGAMIGDIKPFFSTWLGDALFAII